ncbi:Uncharacterised protein [Streptococcus dysgalactiae subsp. equisimilis]|nr:Uncharacterised protein [Streptococcus dysgalactiae subsp. equisimilis]
MPGPGPGVHPGKMKPAHHDCDGWSRGRGGVAEVTPSAVDKWLSVDNRMVKSFRRVLRNARMVDCKTASPVVGIDRYQGSTPSMLAEVAAPPGGGTACPSIYRSAPERSDSSVRSPPARFHLARPRRRYSLYPWSPPDRPHPAHPGPLAMPRCQRGVVTQARPCQYQFGSALSCSSRIFCTAGSGLPSQRKLACLLGDLSCGRPSGTCT